VTKLEKAEFYDSYEDVTESTFKFGEPILNFFLISFFSKGARYTLNMNLKINKNSGVTIAYPNPPSFASD